MSNLLSCEDPLVVALEVQAPAPPWAAVVVEAFHAAANYLLALECIQAEIKIELTKKFIKMQNFPIKFLTGCAGGYP